LIDRFMAKAKPTVPILRVVVLRQTTVAEITLADADLFS
jgi:hypothetical protein